MKYFFWQVHSQPQPQFLPMKFNTLIYSSMVLVFTSSGLLFQSSCSNSHSNETAPAVSETISEDSLLKRGEYLVNSMGCEDCHSPKQMGPKGPELVMEQRFGGYPADRPLSNVNKEEIGKGWVMFNADLTAAIGPWGVSYARNISSDESGIGNWTFEQFKKAMTEGKLNGGDNTRMLQPPMPWFNYRNLKEEDVRAIYVYLKNTKPVKNNVPEIQPLSELN